MSVGGLISSLEVQLEQVIQKKAKGYWEARNADAYDYKDEFLSVSWQGSIRYLMARHYHQATLIAAMAHKAANRSGKPSPLPVGPIMRRFGFLQTAGGFWRCFTSCLRKKEKVPSQVYEDGPYHLDCTVFHKSSHIEPDSLRKLFSLAPNGPSSPVGVVPGFAAVPLNHFYMVCREEPVRMLTPPPNVQTNGVLAISQHCFREPAQVIDHLVGEIFPENLLQKADGGKSCLCICRLFWFFLLPLVTAIALAFAAYFYCPPCHNWMNRIWQERGFTPNDEMRAQIEELTAERDSLVTQYQAAVDELARMQVLCSEDPYATATDDPLSDGTCSDDVLVEMERLESEVANLRNQRDDLQWRLWEAQRRMGLDEPPCWPSLTDNRHTPVYLFDVFADRGGLRVTASENALTRAAEGGWPVERLPRDEVITLDQFARGAAAIYALSEARSCRHFVVLREGEHDSAAQYQAQRDMVEQYFYIYRPSNY